MQTTERNMTKIAIVDLDGVIANTEARFAIADESGHPKKGDGSDAYWKVAFDPELVIKDEPIEGAKEALQTLQGQGWHIVILTSRPVNLYGVTLGWLEATGLVLSDQQDLILKPFACRWQKTKFWKADMIAVLTQTANEALVVDDEEENLDTIANHRQLNWRMQNRGFRLRVVSSLKVALTEPKMIPLEEDLAPEDIPF